MQKVGVPTVPGSEGLLDGTEHAAELAKKWGYDYWDGDRRYGYGGYRYLEGYWVPVAKLLIEAYSLTEKSLVLDVGCGKGYLLYELTRLLPGLRVSGLDISRYGIDHAKEEIQEIKNKLSKIFFN